MIFVSIPTLLDSSLTPEGKHIVHAFTPSSISEWEGYREKNIYKRKKNIFRLLLKKFHPFSEY